MARDDAYGFDSGDDEDWTAIDVEVRWSTADAVQVRITPYSFGDTPVWLPRSTVDEGDDLPHPYDPDYNYPTTILVKNSMLKEKGLA
jgi:hypothetical protein